MNIEKFLGKEVLSDKINLDDIKQNLILVLGDTNDLYYFENGKKKFYYKCITGSNGFGNEIGTYKTPLGLHKIIGKYGDNLDISSIFKARRYVGNFEFYPEFGKVYPVISTRILQLHGLEKRNSNTKQRCIYIHGTPNTWYWDTNNLKRSYGCITLPPIQMFQLFELVKNNENTYVYITNNKIGQK